MEIFLDKRAVRQIRLSAQDAIEEGDTETLREDILEAFTEEQVEEIERRLDTGDFFEFLTDLLDEWSGDDADELLELIDTQLGDVGVDLKFEKRGSAPAEGEEDEPPAEFEDEEFDEDEDEATRTKTRKKRKKRRRTRATDPRRVLPSVSGGRFPVAPLDVLVAVPGRAARSRARKGGAFLDGARHVAAVGELLDQRREAPAGRARVAVLAP